MARTDQRALPVWLIVLAALLLVTRIVSYAAKETVADAVQWMSIEEGRARAAATNKPILYDFTAEWCAPCHQLDAEVFANVDLARQINERFVPIRVTDRQQEEGRNKPEVQALQRKFGVSGFPTLVFAGADGVEQARMEGFRGVREFQRVMDQAR